MVKYIAITFACASVLALAVIQRIMICNHRTVMQRHAMIDFIWSPHQAGKSDSLQMFYNLVPYEAHLWCLFFFRNPKYLYHFSLWDGLP